jgi:hypothetical protein
MERLLATLPTGNGTLADNCGKGLKLAPRTAPQRCSVHGHECWFRESPKEVAQAAMLLEAIERRLPEPDIDNPPAELIEEARRMLLSQGKELVAEED